MSPQGIGPERLRLPDGTYINVPSSYTDEDWKRLYYRLSQDFPEEIGKPFYESQRTPLGGAASFIAGIPRGVVGTGLSAAQGIVGLLTPGFDTDVERGLRSIQESDIMNTSPEYRDTWQNKLGTGLGSVLPFMGAGLAGAAIGVGRGVGAGALGVTAGMGEQSQRIARQNAVGEDVGALRELGATLFGGAIGATEAIPASMYLGKISKVAAAADRMSAQKLTSSVLSKIPARYVGMNAVARVIPGMVKSALTEGFQEAVAMIGQDLVEKGIYNENLRVGESALDEFLVGGGVGAIVDIAMVGLGAHRSRMGASGIRQKDVLAAANRADALMEASLSANSRTDQQIREYRRAMTGVVEDQDEFDLSDEDFRGIINSEFIVQPSPGSGYNVVDRTTGAVAQGLQIFQSEVDAREAAAQMNDLVVDMGVAGGLEVRLAPQGLARNPTALGLALSAEHPDISMIPTYLVAHYDSRGQLRDNATGEKIGVVSSFLARNNDVGALLSMEQVHSKLSPKDAARITAHRATISSSVVADRTRAERIAAREAGKPTNLNVGHNYIRTLAKAYDGDVIDPGLVSLDEDGMPTINANDTQLTRRFTDALAQRGIVLGGRNGRKVRKDINKKAFYDNGGDPGLAHWLARVTGGRDWRDMTKEQKVLAIVTLEQAPISAEEISFPDMSPLTYTPEHMEAASTLLAENGVVVRGDLMKRFRVDSAEERKDAKTTGLPVNMVAPGSDYNAASEQQIFDHLVASGKAVWTTEGIKAQRESKVPERPIPDDIEDQIKHLVNYLPEGKNRDVYTRYLVQQFSLLPEGTDTSVKGTPEEKAAWTVEALGMIAEGHKEFKEILSNSGLNEFVELAEIDEGDIMVQALRDAGIKVIDPNKVAAYSHPLNKIMLFASNIDPDGNLSPPEVKRRVLEAYKHEVFHSIIERKYWNDAQLESMFRTVRRSKVPAEVDKSAFEADMTWYDLAKRDQVDRSTSEVELEKEAAAILFEAFATEKLPARNRAGLIRTLFTDPSKIVSAAVDASTESQLRETLSVFAQVWSGDLAKLGPGRDHLNKDGEIRAPRYLLRTAPTVERTKEIIDRFAMRSIYELGEQPALPEGATETVTTDAVPDRSAEELSSQLDIFGAIIGDATNGKGTFALMDDIGVGGNLTAEIHNTPDGPIPSYHLTLSGKNSTGVLNGLAKLFGDALGMDQAEVRVVVQDASVGEAAFGVVLDIPDGVNVDKLHKKVSTSLGGGLTINRLGDRIVVMDETSTDESYTEEDAIVFAEMMTGELKDLGITPYGFFLQTQKFANAADGPLPDGVESYEGGLEDIEASREKLPHERIWEQRIPNRDDFFEGPSSRLPSPRGASYLQRSAIRSVFEPITEAIEKATGHRVENSYFKPRSSVKSPVSEGVASENAASIEASNSATPPGYVYKYGNMSETAADVIIKAAKFGLIDAEPETAAKYSTKLDRDPEIEKMVTMRAYGDVSPPLFHRMQDFMDSPNQWGETKNWLEKAGRKFKYNVLTKWQAGIELDEKLAKARGEKSWASESIYGALALMVDKVQGLMHTGVAFGPIMMKGDMLNGGMVVNEEGVTDEDGNHYTGLESIFRLLSPDGKRDMRSEGLADDVLIALEGLDLLAIRERATAEMSAGKGTMSKERKVFLQGVIDRAKALPGYPGIKTQEDIDKTAVALRRTVHKLSVDHPNIPKFVKAFRAWNNQTIKLMVDTGQIDPNSDYYRDWMERPNFVPFYRTTDVDIPEYLVSKYRKKDRAGQHMKVEEKLGASSRPIDIPLVDRLLANYHSIIRDGAMNVARNRVVNGLTELGMVTESGDGSADGEGVIVYHENGHKKYVKTNDTMLVNSLSAASGAFNVGPIAKLLMFGPAKMMRELITRTPTFILRQAIRDPTSAWVTTGAYDQGVKGLIDILREFKNNVLDKSVYDKAVKHMVAMEHDYYSDPHNMRKGIEKIMRMSGEDSTSNAAIKLWDALGDLSKRTEAATRMSVWERVMEETGDEFEANLQALETVNFGRRGANPVLSTLFAMIPFANASIQGLDVMWRSNITGEYSALDKGMTSEEIRARAWSRGALLVAASLALRAYWRIFDEDEYENTRKELREDNWLIPVPGMDKPMRVPIPFEVGVIYKALPEIALNALLDRSMDGVGTSVAREFKSSASIFVDPQSLIPQFMSPLFDIYMNKNSFTGYPITPFYMDQGVEPGQQSRFNTNAVAKVTGEALGISPIKLQYLAENYFPGLGLYLFAAADAIARKATGESVVGTRSDPLSPRNLPLLRGLVQNGGGYQQQFYELQEEVDRMVGSLNKMKSEGDMDAYRLRREAGLDLLKVKGRVESLARYMTHWRANYDRILRDKTMSAAEQRERIKALEHQRDRRLAVVPALTEMALGKGR